jgi:hypothetical protein
MFPWATIVWDHVNAKGQLYNVDTYLWGTFSTWRNINVQRPPLHQYGIIFHSKV